MTYSKDEEEGFLSRWSQRKSAARRGQPVAPEPKVETREAPAAQVPAPRAAEPANGREARADGAVGEPRSKPAPPPLPPLESLTPDSDYSPFFAEGVSKAVRRAALRKLFSAPEFNVTDGLDDYCEDFASFRRMDGVVTQEMRYRWEVEAREEERKARLRAEREDRERRPSQAAQARTEPAPEPSAPEPEAAERDVAAAPASAADPAPNPPSPNAEEDPPRHA